MTCLAAESLAAVADNTVLCAVLSTGSLQLVSSQHNSPTDNCRHNSLLQPWTERQGDAATERRSDGATGRAIRRTKLASNLVTTLGPTTFRPNWNCNTPIQTILVLRGQGNKALWPFVFIRLRELLLYPGCPISVRPQKFQAINMLNPTQITCPYPPLHPQTHNPNIKSKWKKAAQMKYVNIISETTMVVFVEYLERKSSWQNWIQIRFKASTVFLLAMP